MAQSQAQAADTEEQTESRKQPVDRFHEGRVHVSIFPQESSRGTFHTANFRLRYKKGEGFHTGTSYSQKDCEDLGKASAKAADVIKGLDKGREESRSR